MIVIHGGSKQTPVTVTNVVKIFKPALPEKQVKQRFNNCLPQWKKIYFNENWTLLKIGIYWKFAFIEILNFFENFVWRTHENLSSIRLWKCCATSNKDVFEDVMFKGFPTQRTKKSKMSLEGEEGNKVPLGLPCGKQKAMHFGRKCFFFVKI